MEPESLGPLLGPEDHSAGAGGELVEEVEDGRDDGGELEDSKVMCGGGGVL